MTTTLSFQGKVSAPAEFGVGEALGCSVGGASAALELTLDGLVAEYDCVQMGSCDVAAMASYEHLEGLPDAMVVSFLALSLEEGSTAVQLLIGSEPMLTGDAGTFPTLFVGGETFTFTVETFSAQGGTVLFTVATTFQVGDQTAVQVARRINAAALLAGLEEPPASVLLGQLLITGPTPGGEQALNVTVPNATIGFPTAGEILGTGAPVPVDRVYVASISGGMPANMIWVKGGPATLRFLAAGA